MTFGYPRDQGSTTEEDPGIPSLGVFSSCLTGLLADALKVQVPRWHTCRREQVLQHAPFISREHIIQLPIAGVENETEALE